jgi:serine/threonine protein kinase
VFYHCVMPEDASSAGGTIGRYRLLRRLGAGGMGEVFLAHDPLLDRNVAIKLVVPEGAGREAWRARMLREARAAARLEHPNVCVVYEAGLEQDSVYLVMQFLDGTTVSQRWQERVGTVDDILVIATGVLSALAEAHRLGIVHRDIKPQNVMLTSKGVKVLDFGLARIEGAEAEPITRSGIVSGTTSYMSPEQLRLEPLDGRSDIFSLGVMLYQLLAGRRPFDRDSVVDTIAAILHEPAPPLDQAGLRGELERLVLRMLEKVPRARPTAEQAILEIQRLTRRERDEEGTPTVQIEVSRSSTGQAQTQKTPGSGSRSSATSMANPEQQTLYARGRHLLAKRTVPHVKQSLETFQQLIDLDPECAPAFAGLADCYLLLGFLQALAPRATFPKARAACQRAIQLDPMRADAHATLGYLSYLHDWNVADAERELRLALTLEEGFATAHHWLGLVLAATGRLGEARQELIRARDLDALSPIFATAVAFPDMYEQKPQAALRIYAEVVELYETFVPVHYYRGLALEQVGRLEDAIAEFERADAMAPGKLESFPASIHALARHGDVVEARRRLERLHADATERFVPPLFFAVAHLGLEEFDAAFAALDEAVEQRAVRLSELHFDRRFDVLPDRERFTRVLQHIGVAPHDPLP